MSSVITVEELSQIKELPVPETGKKRCSRCRQVKSLTFFSKRSFSIDGLYPQCKDCHHIWYAERKRKDPNYVKKIIETKKAKIYGWLYKYLKVHPCVDCGETDVVVLEFDHIDPTKKLGNVSSMLQRLPLEVVEQEVKKCQVRCANCHRRKTARDRNWYILRLIKRDKERGLMDKKDHLS